MSFVRSCLRYAHTNGYTALTYTPNGEYILTCGSDGDLRRWTCISDDDPSSTCLGEFIMGIAHTGTRLIASTDRNTIQAYTFPDMESDGILMRFTAPATCICVNGDYTAAGSDDTKIKIIRGEDPSSEIVLDGHTGPILGLDLYSERQLVASIGGDGQLRVWNFKTSTEVKSIAGLPRINSFETATLYGTPSFEPTRGDQLAYILDKDVIVLNTSNWEIAFKLHDEHVTSNYSCCQFSPDGMRLVAGTTSGELSIFDMKRRKALKVEAPPSDCKAITCIAWNPSNENELAFCDVTGQLGTIYVDDAEEIADGIDGIVDAQDENLFGDDYDGIEFDGDGGDDDDGAVISLKKLKDKVMSKSVYTEDESALHSHDDEHSKQSLISTSAPPEPRLFKQQVAFQPSSTPSHLEHRYMVWNDVGIVIAHTQPTGDGAIDVEFHDASVHHALHISNYNQHNMASLSRNALALAAIDSSKLVVIALAAAGNKEWSISLPDCESVEAVVATNNLIAVATSSSLLRLFSVMGTQREVLSVPGPVVAIAGHDDQLIVVYHSSGPSATQQYLSAMFVRVSGLNVRVDHGPLPLTPGRQLSWLGYSDVGSPVFIDNMGLMQLYRVTSRAWFPICDTMKQSSSVSHNYFVISLSERSQIIQAVLCRGTSYPMTNPRPMLHELRIQLPLCQIEAEKSEIEDTLIRASIMQLENAEKIQKEMAIKLFALACRTECEARAKELVESIACTELLQLAVKYASKLGRIHLSDRLCELLPQLEAIQEARKQQELLGANGIAATIVLPTIPMGTPNNTGTKLAPKAMELSTAKRSALKRFSNSPILQKSTISRPSTPTGLDTQENIFGENETQPDMSTEQRTPLNSVNPFAMKRKLTDTGVIFGSEKLKLSKK